MDLKPAGFRPDGGGGGSLFPPGFAGLGTRNWAGRGGFISPAGDPRGSKVYIVAPKLDVAQPNKQLETLGI